MSSHVKRTKMGQHHPEEPIYMFKLFETHFVNILNALLFLAVITALTMLLSRSDQTDAALLHQEVETLREEVKTLKQDKVETKERTKK